MDKFNFSWDGYEYYPVEDQELSNEEYIETMRYWEEENLLLDEGQDTVTFTVENMRGNTPKTDIFQLQSNAVPVPTDICTQPAETNIGKPHRITVTPHTVGNGFELELLNGSVSIPDQQSGYIVSCGCGAGKTTAIRQLICQRYQDGVLYAVDTVEELEKMYEYLCLHGITDIVMLHSNVNKDILNSYYQCPETIMRKKVVLITHCRLFTDLINYFLVYKPYAMREDFDGNFQKLMSRQDLRKYIILDETPLFFKPFASISFSALGNFADYENGQFKPKGEAEIQAYYKRFIEGTANDFYSRQSGLSIRKKSVLLNLLRKNFDTLISNERKQDADFHFYTSDLVQQGMKTHVLMFEGAGDILIGRHSKFELIDIPQKYNSTVNFKPFHFSQERKDRNFVETEDFRIMLNSLVDIINNSPYHSVVVVWKSIGSKGEDDAENEGAGQSAYRDFVRDELIRYGADREKLTVDDGNSTVTYYGAANTKSTNLFRECRNIILVGKWSVKGDKAKQVCKAYGSSTTAAEQRLWYFVQLINRTALRLHDPNITVNVYYSEDFPINLISELDAYLNTNIYARKSDGAKDVLDERLAENGVRAEIRRDIAILSNGFNKAIGDHIISGCDTELCLTIPRYTLYNLCQRKEQKPSKYKALLEKLKAFNIYLTIEKKGDFSKAV